MLTLLVLAGLSLASDPDGVVSTAPRGADSVVVGAVAPLADALPDASLIAPTAQSLTTAEQIDRWVSSRTAADAPFARDAGPVDDRKMHGFVSGAIGTGDYQAVVTGVSLPLGETGWLDLIYSQSKNGYGYGHAGRVWRLRPCGAGLRLPAAGLGLRLCRPWPSGAAQQ